MRRLQLTNVILSLFLCLLCTVEANAQTHPRQQFRTFTIDRKTQSFVKDGKPFQYISGSMHYFRIPFDYWQDRVAKAKRLGLDAVEMYIPWNYHEPEEGQYQFTAGRDLEKFIQTIAKENLLAIVRAGPYICAEWAFGGLPPWLLRKNPDMVLRSSQLAYYKEVEKWFNVLLPKLKKYLYTKGGPIIMVQLENEYGSYPTCDHRYMSNLYNLARSHLGSDVILFTTDGPSEQLLKCGSPDPRYLATVDFGPSQTPPNVSFASVEHFRPGQPLINSEFYVGWFDPWGDNHTRTDKNLVATSLLRQMNYSIRVNVNLYVFHGGTTFGFWNGKPQVKPVTTSYDFDALLSEAGDVTEKYSLLQQTIYKFRKLPPPPLPKNITRVAYNTVRMHLISHLLMNLTKGIQNSKPLNMESLRQYEGFMVYRATIPDPKATNIEMTLKQFRDVAHIYTSNKRMDNVFWHCSLEGLTQNTTIDLSSLPDHDQLLLLLENTGYVNYGRGMQKNIKGLFDAVLINNVVVGPWTMFPIRKPFIVTAHTQSKGHFAKWPTQGMLFGGEFRIAREDEIQDTYIQASSFSRGLIAVNNHVLGRFDQELGPQMRLYVPRSFLKVGVNHIVVGELRRLRGSDVSVSFATQQWWLK